MGRFMKKYIKIIKMIILFVLSINFANAGIYEKCFNTSNKVEISSIITSKEYFQLEYISLFKEHMSSFLSSSDVRLSDKIVQYLFEKDYAEQLFYFANLLKLSIKPLMVTDKSLLFQRNIKSLIEISKRAFTLSLIKNSSNAYTVVEQYFQCLKAQHSDDKLLQTINMEYYELMTMLNQLNDYNDYFHIKKIGKIWWREDFNNA